MGKIKWKQGLITLKKNWYGERLWHNGIEIHFGNNEKV